MPVRLSRSFVLSANERQVRYLQPGQASAAAFHCCLMDRLECFKRDPGATLPVDVPRPCQACGLATQATGGATHVHPGCCSL